MEREAARLHQLWATLFKELGTPTPSITEFYVWLTKYPARTIELAIHSVLKKTHYMSKGGEVMDFNYQLNYAGKVMKLETQREIEQEMAQLGPTTHVARETKSLSPQPEPVQELTHEQKLMQHLDSALPATPPLTTPAPKKSGVHPYVKPVINPFTGQPLLNPLTGKPVMKEEK